MTNSDLLSLRCLGEPLDSDSTIQTSCSKVEEAFGSNPDSAMPWWLVVPKASCRELVSQLLTQTPTITFPTTDNVAQSILAQLEQVLVSREHLERSLSTSPPIF
ncbi:unnamed protein product [Lota lota]